MGRKVFISVLGTGFYQSCKYVDGDFVSSDTRFVQKATLECIDAAHWSATDTALVLLTAGARVKNWNTSTEGRDNFTTRQSEVYGGLKDEIEEMNLPILIDDVTIPDGKNEEEMWQIFKILYEKLNDDDELYFDLTHSFRYLPMLVLVFGNYAKFLKKAKIIHISYGNYEARDEQSNEAPIIDLRPFSTLQDWSFAAASFLESGNVSPLIDLCNNSLNPILRDAERRENDPSLSTLSSYVKTLGKVVVDMQMCRGVNIVKSARTTTLMKLSSQLQQTIIEPMNPILEKLKDSFIDFTPSLDIQNGYAAAQWCFDHGLYQQSLTILQENMVSHVCMLEGMDWIVEKVRELVNEAFYRCVNENAVWRCAEDQRETVKYLMKSELVRALVSSYSETTNLRNDYNHSGIRENPAGTRKMASQLGKQLKKIRTIVSSNTELNADKSV